VTASPRILLTGATGQAGRELKRSFAGFGEIISVDRELLDLSAPHQIRDTVRRIRPDVILNAAAYTAVDRAESEPDLAMAINAEAPAILAEEARTLNALLVHYSTDYVFDGSKSEPWTESDSPQSLNVYGASKLAGELAIRRIGGRYLIFRTSWVYGPQGRNFFLTMMRLGRERDRLTIVDDQFGAPTTSIEIADATRAVVEGIFAGRFGTPEMWAGLYHMTCSGSTTWFGFARAIFARAAHLLPQRQPELIPVSTSEFPTPATRPRNSVLSNSLLIERFGIRLSPWETALGRVIDLTHVS
jgi:dTDP-4-dehydrorhamnose reductase